MLKCVQCGYEAEYIDNGLSLCYIHHNYSSNIDMVDKMIKGRDECQEYKQKMDHLISVNKKGAT